MCDNSHLSFEFITRKQDGLLLYNGPIVPPELEETMVSGECQSQFSAPIQQSSPSSVLIRISPSQDFISVELERGMPRLLIDFGSGTLELKVKTRRSLDDGEWHRIDIFWNTEVSPTSNIGMRHSSVNGIPFSQVVKLIVDYCKSANITEVDDGSSPNINDASCQAQGVVPPFNEYLNVNAPLQIGGLYVEQFEPDQYKWKYMPVGKGFDGCIKNLFHNSKLYDLAHPGLSRNSVAGCPQTDEICGNQESTLRCWEHGTCVGSFKEAMCQCNPGWSGPGCMIKTVPTSFKEQSYVKYALSFEPDKYSTQIQLRFRTRETQGELFRVSDQHNREYAVLEVSP